MARRLVGQGKGTATLSFALGGSQTLRVTVDRTFTGDFVAMAGIASQTIGLLGTVRVAEARQATDGGVVVPNAVDVVLTSSSILSSVTVTVNVVAIGMM